MARRASPPRPETRFEQRRRRNRQALIDAGIELFQQRGVRGAKLEDICERADVSPRTFFNHFETREHLYRAIAEQRATQLAALFDAAPEGSALTDRLPELFARIADYLDERPLYRELVGEMLHARSDGASEVVRARPLGQAARRFVESAVARGEVTRALGADVLADVLLGTLVIALMNWSASESYRLRSELRRSADALLVLFAGGPRESRR